MPCIKTCNWKFNQYFEKIMSIVLDQNIHNTIAKDLNLSSHQLTTLIKQHIPFYHPSKKTGQIKIFKNKDLVYCNYNFDARLLGNRKNKTNLKGITDYQLYPKEFAEKYVAMDSNTIKTNNITTREEYILHQIFGKIIALGHSTPVFNEHRDCIGVLIFGEINIKISETNFPTVLNHLNNGLAKYFVKQKNYDFFLNSNKIKITAKQTEFLLYYIAGLSSKTIAKFMKISSRTVEKYIINIKEIFNIYTRNQLICLLYDYKFFDIL